MQKTIAAISTLILVLTLSACSASSAETISGVSSGQSENTTTVSAPSAATGAATVAEALAENSTVHEDASDYTWEDAVVIPITLNGDSISVDGEGVTVEGGGTATITAAGTYSLSGALDDGQIIVNSEAEGMVRLILNGVDIHNSSSAAIYILQSDETLIYLAENTDNTISDGEDYVLENPDTDEPNAAIFSAADLTIFGSGSLSVQGNNNDGIASKDGLIIASGTINVTAVDDGVRGKDYLVIEDGAITVEAGGDGLKADNAEDAAKGFISIEAGVLNITAGGDAISAQTDVMVRGGEITVHSGGGSGAWADETISAKGIKGVVSVNIDGGTLCLRLRRRRDPLQRQHHDQQRQLRHRFRR